MCTYHNFTAHTQNHEPYRRHTDSPLLSLQSQELPSTGDIKGRELYFGFIWVVHLGRQIRVVYLDGIADETVWDYCAAGLAETVLGYVVEMANASAYASFYL